jgi:hypothetical protein
MKTILCTSVIAASLALGLTARATTSASPQTVAGTYVGQNEFTPMAFSDSEEAKKLRRAYVILATGDHDYAGHRVKAMHAVEAAGKLLGMDLAGDLKDRTPQVLSDDKLREAQGLITEVLGAAEVKDQKRITKRLDEAVNQINDALATK